jgi:hypothetical protein
MPTETQTRTIGNIMSELFDKLHDCQDLGAELEEKCRELGINLEGGWENDRHSQREQARSEKRARITNAGKPDMRFKSNQEAEGQR